MDYIKNADRRIIDGHEICFVRCDRFGNEISAEKLKEISFSNFTIDRIVSDVALRMSGDGAVAENIFNDGITSE